MNKQLIALHKTGWQSWSWDSSQPFLHFPQCNFAPKKNYVPKQSAMSRSRTMARKPPVWGWCSWYSFADRITESAILFHARWFSQRFKQPFYILVDDGWETRWGDWSKWNAEAFPHGMKKLASEIQATGCRPGIWIAPFLADPRSDLFTQHPDWFLKNDHSFLDGLQMTVSGIPSFYQKYVLDIRLPPVVRYIEESIDRLINEWGYQLLKLDFLYSIYIHPHLSMHDCDVFLSDFLKKIAKRYPDLYTIACGCPLIPAAHNVDAMRIGPDIIIPLFQQFPLLNRLSNQFLLRKVMYNIERRSWTSQFWNIDCDAFLCHPNFGYTDAQLKTISDKMIEMRGNMFFGDNLATLPEYHKQTYMVPLLKKAV